MLTILFHGPSGCGKDTQLEYLQKDYGFENIGTGDMFRKLYEQKDPDAIIAHEYWNRGEFVPNDLVYKMFPKWLKQFDPNKNWAFVSTVRDAGQIPMFDALLESTGRTLDRFVHFKLSEETAIERMSLRWICPECGASYHEKFKKEDVKGICNNCGAQLIQREDDKPGKISNRLKEYNRTIEPILEEYRNRGILLEIDAAPSIEEIHNTLIKELGL